MPKVLLLCFCLFISNSVLAEFEGYLKSLWLASDTLELPLLTQASEDFYYGANRWRLEYGERIGSVRLNIQYDMELRLGDYLDTQQYQLLESLIPEPYWHLQQTEQNSNKREFRHGVYRATLNIPFDSVDLRVGRQQVNWSRTFLWSSFDRFNPYDPLQIETEERRGVDGLRFNYAINELESVEWVAVGGHNSDERGFGVLWKQHFVNTDVDLLIANFGDVDSVGVAGAGQMLDAGWRMELTHNRNRVGDTYNEWIASVDYTFATQTTLIGEVLYRGDGQAAFQDYDLLALLRGERTNLAQRYIGMVIRQGFEPLAGVDLTWLHNVDDQSSAWIPSIRYTPGRVSDLQLRGGALVFAGDNDSEYGQQENIVFIELQWFY